MNMTALPLLLLLVVADLVLSPTQAHAQEPEQSKTRVPTSIHAFLESLPKDVTLSTMPASPAKPMSTEAFLTAWALGTVLLREGRAVHFAQLPTPGQFLIASAKDIVGIAPALRPIQDDAGRHHVTLWTSPALSALVFTPPYLISTIASLSQPWRPLLLERFLDAPQVPVKLQPAPPAGQSVPLSTLGLIEASPTTSNTTQWRFSVGPSQISPPLQPQTLRAQLVMEPPLSDTPTLLSLYINDIPVQVVRLKNTGDLQTVMFVLPWRYLHRANTFKLVAQRAKSDDGNPTAVPVRLLPSSTLEAAPQTMAPTTFAGLNTRLAREVRVYLPRSVLARPSATLAFLSRLSADYYVFPDPANVVFYEEDAAFRPTGPFLLIGHPEDPPAAPVQFTRGRVQIVDPDSAPILDIMLDTKLAVAQVAHSHGYPGLWINATNIQELPLPPSLELEGGDVAIFSNQGQIFAMTSTAADPVTISYPDDMWWPTIWNYRYYWFSLAWLTFTAFMIYLFRVVRRQEEAAATPNEELQKL